ncbi:conserved hypothetical protein [Tenacibaculum maritimum]|nr:conserved hypothetical protein [Tenacibaculum maritimum]
MTKQQKTYLLLTLTVIVWGLIGHRIYKSVALRKENASDIRKKQQYIPREFRKVNLYVVEANYRDPFLGEFYIQKNKEKKVISKKNSFSYPNVVYNGIVEGGGVKLYTITINGRQDLLRVGDGANGIKLIRGNEEEILVRFHKIDKTIKFKR